MQQNLLDKIKSLPEDEKAEILRLLEELNDAKGRVDAQKDFLSFVKTVWPAFIEGDHHKVMSDAFNRIADGSLKRLIINMTPRHTKSEFAPRLQDGGVQTRTESTSRLVWVVRLRVRVPIF